MAGFLDHLRRARTLLADDITHGVNDDLIDGEKFAEHLCAAQANADDAEAHDITRFEPDADHRSLLRSTELRGFCFRRIRVTDTRGREAYSCEAGGFQ